jgi:hypothetical protein
LNNRRKENRFRAATKIIQKRGQGNEFIPDLSSRFCECSDFAELTTADRIHYTLFKGVFAQRKFLIYKRLQDLYISIEKIPGLPLSGWFWLFCLNVQN